MGVLPCNRIGCENIMCDRHSWKYGYICNDCFNELKARITDISIFMNTEKQKYFNSVLWEDYLNSEFEER